MTRAEIGYVSPMGKTAFFDSCGRLCSGAGYRGPMYPAEWLAPPDSANQKIFFKYDSLTDSRSEIPNVINLKPKALQYSISYCFESLAEYKEHIKCAH